MNQHAIQPNDHFVERDGQRFAGAHIIVDMWGAHCLDDPVAIEAALRAAADAAGATTLDCRLHRFSTNNGITGVLLLAESHISIHTWPEHGFAALDIFMCGDTDPDRAVGILRQRLRPEQVDIKTIRRGLMR